MTISRISIKVGARGKGIPHLNYMLALGRYKNKSDEVKFIQSGNMPKFAAENPQKFWRAADERERANGTAYREHILSLPRELNLKQQIALVEEWVQKQLKNHPYTFAIHHTKAADGKLNPHAHLMFSDRQLDGIERTEAKFFKRANKKEPEKGGAAKANSGLTHRQRKEKILETRKAWGEHLKMHLWLAGEHEAVKKVDMRNWRERGLREQPKNKSMAETNKEKRLDEMLDKRITEKEQAQRQEWTAAQAQQQQQQEVQHPQEPPAPSPRKQESYDFEF